MALQFAAYVFVAAPVDKGIIGRLVAQDAHFGVGVVLHAEAVAVEMVGSDVEQYGHIGTEVEHAIELEGGNFDDVTVVVVFSHLKRQTAADVSGQSHVEAGFAGMW